MTVCCVISYHIMCGVFCWNMFQKTCRRVAYWFLSFRLTKSVSHPPSRGGSPPLCRWASLDCNKKCAYMQTGSYQTGSYQKGRFIPPKPKSSYLMLFDTTPFICLCSYHVRRAAVRLPGADAARRRRAAGTSRTGNMCVYVYIYIYIYIHIYTYIHSIV